MASRRDAAQIARAIDQAMRREPADLVIADVRLYDLVTGELSVTDIAICGDRIVGADGRYEGRQRLEGHGRIAVPGFVDTHLHIESSLVTPAVFDEMVLPHGVTTCLWDPHEIANVLGAAALKYALDAAEACVADIRVNLSSCVPATHLETSGARLEAEDLIAFRQHPRVLGLAEFMNVPGVVHKDPGALAKLAAFSDGHIDGHAPLVRGDWLDAYLAAGVRTDHETTGADEAREKLRKGMTLLIREGSVSKDLDALAEVLTLTTSPFCGLCTDDRNPLDIEEQGHLDFMISRLIAHGVPPLAAYRAASWSGANAFGLRDRGLLAPGWRADVALIDALETCRVSNVVAGGRVVTQALFDARPAVQPVGLDSMRLPAVTAAMFEAPGGNRAVPVIGVVPGRIITDHLTFDLPAGLAGAAVDPAQDVAKVAVIERHGQGGGHSVGFVHGFGLRRGAIASSVGHDCHNVCVVGMDEADMAVAVKRLGEIGGGFVVAAGGEVLAELALPLAGLMSLLGAGDVRDALVRLRQAARALGCTLPEPFLQVAFLPLPVIPHLKLTDRGMVDVDLFDFIRW